jgi:hypothetical protein
MACFVATARQQTLAHTKESRWIECPTCHQDYFGDVQHGLADAHWELVQSRPAEDEERLFAASNLARVLGDRGGGMRGDADAGCGMRDAARARTLLEQNLEVRRRVLGSEYAETLKTIENLGVLLLQMGDDAAAEPLLQECLDTHRRTLGDAHSDTVRAVANLAGVHSSRGNLEVALALNITALAGRRQSLGSPGR